MAVATDNNAPFVISVLYTPVRIVFPFHLLTATSFDPLSTSHLTRAPSFVPTPFRTQSQCHGQSLDQHGRLPALSRLLSSLSYPQQRTETQ